MLNVNNLKFPVIILENNNKSIEFVRNKNMLTTASKLTLKRGFILNDIIIDFNGGTYKVHKVNIIKHKFPFWKFEFFNKAYIVDLELEIKEHVDFHKLKEIVKRIIIKEKHIWEIDDWKSFISQIDSSINFQEIINILNKNHN